ncbi:hypothetical protein FIV42_12925 [Persicimonas caeni]|uniref:Uncharacterized protein n=1 Tax=Persicimonas caeni TaxID=2292766 RepID=A0A4Y6PUC2_PERCE|nr:hypothetical protein [Persicimonas caeni]QDG51617.1 hypothetical protein FIV42_12925 [Persicimonas caeni]QED32838.1 hypothetical protein FRD00_12920 [Persicimonas caeni]
MPYLRSLARSLNVSSPTLAVVLAVLLTGGVGCSLEDETVDIDDSDFDPGQATFALGATSSLSNSSDDLVFADDNGTVYTLTESRLLVEEIEFELPQYVECDDIEAQLAPEVKCDSQFDDEVDASDDDISNNAELKIEGPFVLDVATGELTPNIGEVPIPALRYQEIDVEFDEAKSTTRGVSSGDLIVGNTWIVNAAFRDEENNARELAIRVGFSGEVDVEPDGGIDVPEDGRVVFTFDVARFLENVPLTSCLRDGDLKTSGTQVLVTNNTDSGECLNMKERLENTLKASGGVRIEQ